MKQVTIIKNLPDLEHFAGDFLSTLTKQETNKAVVVALLGDLGAGKTTLVQLLAQKLGITEVVTSPTFTIMKGYEASSAHFTHLVHMDAYRIEDLSEVRPLRLEELFAQPKTLFCIEWAEKISAVLPAGTITIDIKTAQEVRTIEVKGLRF